MSRTYGKEDLGATQGGGGGALNASIGGGGSVNQSVNQMSVMKGDDFNTTNTMGPRDSNRQSRASGLS